MLGFRKVSAGIAVAMSLAAPASAAPGPDEKPAAAKPAQTVLIGEKDLNACKRLTPGTRGVKLNLKPDTELGDLIAWTSSITCKQFLLPGTIPANSRKVTVVGPELITPEEAYRLFLGALDSVGLTIEHTGKFERVVETAKIKTMGGSPVNLGESDVPDGYHYVTRMVRREPMTPGEPPIDIHNGWFPRPGAYEFITDMVRVIGAKNAHACKVPPPGKAGVKFNLKPGTKVADLIGWIASVTCKQFLLSDTIGAELKEVTVLAPQLLTPEEAYALFQSALDSVSLTVDGSGDVMRVVKAANTEVYVTRLVRFEGEDPNEVVQILGRIKSERGKIVVIASTGAIVVTDLPANIDRMLRVLMQMDHPPFHLVR
jgi:hypothetical protein